MKNLTQRLIEEAKKIGLDTLMKKMQDQLDEDEQRNTKAIEESAKWIVI